MEYLALIPVVSYVLLLLASRKKHLVYLQKNIAITYLDWLFVPFNFLIAVSISFSWSKFLIILLIMLGVMIWLHYKWLMIKNKPVETKLFFNGRTLSTQGWIHAVFMWVQSSLVLTAFFSQPISNFYYVQLALLFVYIVLYMLFVMLVRRVKVMSKAEMPFLVFGLIALIARFFFFDR